MTDDQAITCRTTCATFGRLYEFLFFRRASHGLRRSYDIEQALGVHHPQGGRIRWRQRCLFRHCESLRCRSGPTLTVPDGENDGAVSGMRISDGYD